MSVKLGRRQPLAGKVPIKPVKAEAAFAAVLTARLRKSRPNLASEDLQVKTCKQRWVLFARRLSGTDRCTALAQDQIEASTHEDWAKLPASVKSIYTKLAAGTGPAQFCCELLNLERTTLLLLCLLSAHTAAVKSAPGASMAAWHSCSRTASAAASLTDCAHAEDSLRYQRQLLAYEKLNPGYTAEMVRSEAHKSARLAARQQAQEKREVLAPLAAIAKPKSAWQLFLIGCTAGTGTSFGSLNREQKVSYPLLDRCRAASAI